MGPEKVPEKYEYDHVGVKSCIFESNSRVTEKICKARRTLNASSGLRVRENGLGMQACCIIFWSVVIPVLTFGAEIWCLNDNDINDILSFQRFAGRRVQRFPHRTPRHSSFYGLGWIRITTFILIKKLLFALSIIKLDENNVICQVFCNSVDSFMSDVDQHRNNINHSPVYDLCISCEKFGLLNTMTSMLSGAVPIPSKKKWSEIVWKKGWELDDNYWRAINTMNKENDLLSSIMSGNRYLAWWQMTDIVHYMIKECECVAKILCHTSLLKCDDYCLKGQPPSGKVCELCDLYAAENIHHLLMQCPGMYTEQLHMHEQIVCVIPEMRQKFADEPSRVFFWLLGRNIPDLSEECHMKFRCIAGKWIYKMYHKAVLNRSGIG